MNTIFHLKKKNGIRTIVIGAGAAGKIVLDNARGNKENNHDIILFIDDDRKKIGGYHATVPIVGPISNIGAFIDEYDIEEVIIAINNYPREKMDELLHILQKLDVRINCLPNINGMVGPHDVKMTRIDIDGLLDRYTNVLDNEEVGPMLKGQTVLVTGGGGSIGSELCRQIYNLGPKNLIIFDIYENSTYEIQQELLWKKRTDNSDVNIISIIGSTYDLKRVDQLINQYRPDYI